MNKSEFITSVKNKYPNEPEFHQALDEVIDSIWEKYESNEKYIDGRVLERLVEPDRVLQFKVEWKDDNGVVQVNTGYRVQYSNVLGPYKGGLRFHPTVNRSILMFLGFEQIFKNSLTGLPLGGGKGGSNFDPKGKSDAEVKRFCEAFMQKLFQYIGHNVDVPAGDIGVGAREIAYMYEEYKRLGGTHPGVLTGKALSDGGSEIRKEATGFGLVYFVEEMLRLKGEVLKDKKVLVSGSGNVAQHAVEKLIELGAKVLTMSDSGGTIYKESGLTTEDLDRIMQLKNEKRGRLSELDFDGDGFSYKDGQKPWSIKADVALPCATQNEIDENDARKLVANNIVLVAEGANMPCTLDAVEIFNENQVSFGPAKACNAGGVAVSGLEMEQNSKSESWSRDEVDKKLREIMKSIHENCVKYGKEGERVNYLKGANIAGFIRVADEMI